MTLNRFEKVAGRSFRDGAEALLAISLLENPDSAACSPHVAFFRHECSAVRGRTRAIALEDVTLTSPEIWVTWDGDALTVISKEEALCLAVEGQPVETEIILAGKFTFTWKRGKCARCALEVMSREGSFRDARPGKARTQEDLASLTAGYKDINPKGREH